MPSTYTTNGGIELPANGEQSGTWGETINDNMSIIDRLTNGVGSISLSGTTHTLTTTDGTLSDGQYNVLVLGGSPSGTNTITISPNDGEHVYIVKNISGQTATFTQGSGASISVLNNTTKIIYADGAGAGAAVVDITGALDLGSLIIAGTSVTATAAELNILDGVTATAAELNYNDITTLGTVQASKTVTANASGDVLFPDGDKAIFGAGSDLQIYHNGTNSIISDEGAGALVVQSNGSGIYLNNGVSENMLTAVIDGAVTLYHDNAVKLATTATGIDVTGAAAFTGSISIDGQNALTPGLSEKTDLDTGIFWPTANTIAVSTAGTERMRIDSEGRLGLNITPSATTAFTVFQNRYLSLYGFDQSQSHILTNTYYPVDNGDYKRQATGTAHKLSMNNGNYIFNIGASGAADSVIAFNQAMTLDSSGNLLVGTTTVGLQNNMSCGFIGLDTTSYAVINHTSGTGGGNYYAAFGYNGSAIGSITQNGTTGVSYNTSSDYRLKTDAQPMTGASDRVLALNPVNFEWISSGERVDGFLAHEAQEIVPECVTGTKDAMRDQEYEVTAAVYEDIIIAAVLDEEGNELEAERTEQRLVSEAVMGTRSVPDYQGIDQSKLVPLLTAALQEALTKIADMEIRLSALEG
jgi:hypothetical protein